MGRIHPRISLPSSLIVPLVLDCNRSLTALTCLRGNAWEGPSLSLTSPVSPRFFCAVLAGRSYPETEQSRIAQSTLVGPPNPPYNIDPGSNSGSCKYIRHRGSANPCRHNPRHCNFLRELHLGPEQPPADRSKSGRCFRAAARATSYLGYLSTSDGCPYQPGSRRRTQRRFWSITFGACPH